MNFEILEPFFINDKKAMRAKVVYETGRKQTIQFEIPKDQETGVNKYWDYVVDNFDVQLLEKKWDDALAHHRKRQEHQREKEKHRPEVERLKRLFGLKTQVFEMPFVKEADVETKSAIRRAPDENILNLIVQDLMKKYMAEQNLDYHSFMDYLDEYKFGQTSG
jgi:hypothetical protein